MRLEGIIRFSIELNPTETVEEAEQRIIEAWVGEFKDGDEIEFEASEAEYDLDEANSIIVSAVKDALEKYSADNVDVVRNEETNCLYVTYHSRHNSFSISDDLINADYVDLNDLEKQLDDLNVGHVW